MYVVHHNVAQPTDCHLVLLINNNYNNINRIIFIIKMNYFIKGILFGCSFVSTYYFISLSKDKYKEILSTIFYETVLFYSYVEINVKQNINLIYNFPIVKDSIYKINMYMFNEVDIIKSNFVFKTCNLKEVAIYNPEYFDFFIYTDYYTLNKIISRNVNISLDVEKCDYKFHLITISISNFQLIDDEKTFIIQINNYYMVNNIIDKYFICFLIYKEYKVYIDPIIVNYKIELLDHEMNYKVITEKEEIVLKKDTYFIKKDEDALFKSDEKISNNMKFVNDEDFEVLKY